MYALILILGVSVQTVGTYPSLPDCERTLQQFARQDVKAACVRQPTAEEHIQVVEKFIKLMPKMLDQGDLK